MNVKRKSLLIIPVPEAERVARAWREKYDPTTRKGLPSHITILYPFVKPDLIDEKIIDRLSEIFRNESRFKFSLTEIGTFPQGVIFIQPEPKENFAKITKKIEGIFGIPTFEGRFLEPRPHLTLANHISAEDFEKLKIEIPKSLNKELPIEADANEIWLMETDETGNWHTREKFGFK